MISVVCANSFVVVFIPVVVVLVFVATAHQSSVLGKFCLLLPSSATPNCLWLPPYTILLHLLLLCLFICSSPFPELSVPYKLAWWSPNHCLNLWNSPQLLKTALNVPYPIFLRNVSLLNWTGWEQGVCFILFFGAIFPTLGIVAGVL